MSEPSVTSTPSVRHGAVFEPVTKGERISSIDVLRGVALLGILLMNIVAFGLPYAYDNPTNSGGAEGPNLVVWITNNMFFEGTMRAIFSMLFGAGVILLTSRAEARGAQAEIADIYYRRTLWLILFGLVHAYFFLWMGEILFYYGVMGLLIYPFRKLKPRSLMIIGLLLLASVVPQRIFGYIGMQEAELESREAQAALAAGETLDRKQELAIEDWEDTLERANPPQWKIDETIEGFQGGYLRVLGQVAPKVAKWQSGGIYFWSPFDILSMMLIGMALLKRKVLTGERTYRFYAAMVGIGYGVGLAINTYETWFVVNSGFDLFTMSAAGISYELGRLPTALGHVGLVMIVCKAGLFRWLTTALAAVGRTALSNYVFHTVVCGLIFTGVGLGLYGEMQRYQLYYVVLGNWLANLILSPIWLRHYRFGPLEWMWRSLTYWKRQPMRRAQPAGVGR